MLKPAPFGAWSLVRARRANGRLRQLIDEMTRASEHRRDLDVQFQRIAAMQMAVDRLMAPHARVALT